MANNNIKIKLSMTEVVPERLLSSVWPSIGQETWKSIHNKSLAPVYIAMLP